MALTIKHKFQCAVADDPTAAAAGEVVPSNWNDTHTATLETGSPLFSSTGGGAGMNANLVATGDISCVLGGFAIFPRYGFGSIWVAVTSPPAIVRIDRTTGLVTNTISVGTAGTNYPTGVCVTDTRVYFNDSLAGRAGYIDPTTNTAVFPAGLASMAPTGSLPSTLTMRGICWDGANLWFGTNTTAGAGTAKKVSPASNTVTASVTIGNLPFYVPAFDGASHVWFPNFTDNTVSRINISTNVVDSTIGTSTGPWALFSNGLTMYLSENGGDTVASYGIGSVNSENGRWTLPAGSGLHDIVVIDNELWITQSSQDKIFVFDILGPVTGTVTAIRNFSVGAAQSDPAGMCFDGRDMWWVNAQGDGGAAAPAAKVKRRRVRSLNPA